MAGFMGIPIGTIGTRPGATDVSPYLRMRQMQIEAEMAQRQQAEKAMEFDKGMKFQQQQFEAGQQRAKADLELRTREFEHQKSMDIENFLAREDAQKQAQEAQKAELDLRTREQASREQARTAAIEQDKANLEAKQAEDVAQKKQGENLADVYSQSKSLIAQRAQQLQGQTPEQIRDTILQEMEGIDVTGEEKMAMQKAVAEWYQQEVKRGQDELARQREERIAQSEKLDIELKNQQLEATKNYRAQQAATSASAPIRAQQNEINKRMADLDTKLATVQGMLEGATEQQKPFYQNAVNGLIAAKGRLRAQYDELETKASAREAEVLARS